MYDNWLFFPLFSSLLEKEKKNELAKPVFKRFSDPLNFYLYLACMCAWGQSKGEPGNFNDMNPYYM